MPASPKVCGGRGEVGVAKVFHEVEAEEAGATAGDSGVGGEVGEDLDGEGEDAGPEDGKSGVANGEDLVGDKGRVVGDDDL